jgi:hypothetical protein
MFRTAVLALALSAAPAVAAPHYQADPVAKPASARFAAKEIVWRCDDSGCSAGKGNSRPALVCAAVARQIGALRSFSAGGRPLAADELAKCNSRARGATGDTVQSAQQ